MATRTKTVEFAHPVLASAVDNTLTTMTQITVYLPESSKTFRSVIATMSIMFTGTAIGNIGTRNLQCRLGAAAYTSSSNANAITASGEDIFLYHHADLTSHFTTNWTGTSMTFDTQFQVDSANTSPAFTNICVTLSITYDYDDTSATQIKTVRIPLSTTTAALGTTKPGTANSTLPVLNTELPETSKVWRNQFITVQGNYQLGTATVDATLSMQLDSTTAHTSGIFEAAQATNFWFRYVWECSSVLDESIAMGFFIWGSAAYFNCLQAWLTLTYEFDATASTDAFVSLLLPAEPMVHIGVAAGGDLSSSTLVLDIPETGVVTKNISFYTFFISDINPTPNTKIGTGSTASKVLTGTVFAGSQGYHDINNSAYTLTSGRNTLQAFGYGSTTNLTYAMTGFWIINYTADKPSQGYGAMSHTVTTELAPASFTAATSARTSSSSKTASLATINIPETDFYLQNIGYELNLTVNSTASISGVPIKIERLTTDPGGVAYNHVVFAGNTATDAEYGLYSIFWNVRDLFRHFPGELVRKRNDTLGMDVESSRVHYIQISNAVWVYFRSLVTYHAILYTVSGTVTGSAGGTVTLSLYNATTGEKLKETTRVGNGSYSFTWYDNTTQLFVEARESGTLLGRSDNGTAV